MTAAFGNSYGYDNNGNQTSRTIGGTPYTFTFDYENRLTAISGGSVSASFVYDAAGNRIKGTVGGVTTVYIAGMYEYQGSATTHYYEGNAFRRAGYASDNGVFYLLQDHLKSSSAVINQNGTLNSQNYYYPYGGNRGSAFSTLTTKRFTGQYHEAGLPGGEGLSYYNARWYDAQLGRFVGADSIVPKPENPQDWNRYTYVRNNPLGYKDSSGHDPWWILDRLPSYHSTPDVRDLVGAYYNGSLGNAVKWPVPPPGKAGPRRAADAVSLYVTGPSMRALVHPVGAYEAVYNFQTRDITLFGVLGVEATVGASLVGFVGQFNAIFDLRSDNLRYRGEFVSLSLSGALGSGVQVLTRMFRDKKDGFAIFGDLKTLRIQLGQDTYMVSVQPPLVQ